MGLFWGNGEKKAAQPQAPADPRTEPFFIGDFGPGVGYVQSHDEFTYIVRDMHLMMKQLLRENYELRQRLDRLETKLQSNITHAL